jgi:hypothetical protein
MKFYLPGSIKDDKEALADHVIIPKTGLKGH